MVSTTTLITFQLVALAMVLSPGPNMAYLISRSICQGRAAGLISLSGVALGFLVYVLLTAFGITALMFAVPYAYDAIRLAGAAYLAWMAWNTLKPGGKSPFEVRDLSADRPFKLLLMGFLTSLLNPKLAALYLSLLPQFVDETRGNVFGQTLTLGAIQIATSVIVNAMIVLTAGSAAAVLTGRPLWVRLQRWFMGTVLGGLAVHVALDTGRR